MIKLEALYGIYVENIMFLISKDRIIQTFIYYMLP